MTCPAGVKGRGAALNQFFLRLHGLWEGIIQTILIAPAWLVFGLPGVALAWLCRDRGRPTGLRR